MKKSSIIALCLFSISLQAAEKERTVNCLVNGTLLSFIKGDISRYGDRAEVMVVGWNQQRKLQEPDFGDIRDIGFLIPHAEKTLYTLPKESDSASDDDTYTPFLREDTDLWKKAQKTVVACRVLKITEPRIMYENFKTSHDTILKIPHGTTHGYFPQRWINRNECQDLCFYGEEAFQEANNDLSRCYQTILEQGTPLASETGIIVINSLSGDVGLRRDQVAAVTFKTITNFLKDKSNKYVSVMVFIKKRFELEFYGKLIAEYLEKK